jgi:hypothetical protein
VRGVGLGINAGASARDERTPIDGRVDDVEDLRHVRAVGGDGEVERIIDVRCVERIGVRRVEHVVGVGDHGRVGRDLRRGVASVYCRVARVGDDASGELETAPAREEHQRQPQGSYAHRSPPQNAIRHDTPTSPGP